MIQAPFVPLSVQEKEREEVVKLVLLIFQPRNWLAAGSVVGTLYFSLPIKCRYFLFRLDFHEQGFNKKSPQLQRATSRAKHKFKVFTSFHPMLSKLGKRNNSVIYDQESSPAKYPGSPHQNCALGAVDIKINLLQNGTSKTRHLKSFTLVRLK